MKILNKRPFASPIHVQPGDSLHVTWTDNDGQVATMKAKIEEKQIFDTAVLVEYTPEEAEALGFESALGMFAGEAE